MINRPYQIEPLTEEELDKLLDQPVTDKGWKEVHPITLLQLIIELRHHRNNQTRRKEPCQAGPVPSK
jgi:hypothetical protein